MVKILNKCILSIKEYNLFLDSAIFYIHRNISMHRWIGCRREIERRNILYTPQYFHTPVNWLSSWNRKAQYVIYTAVLPYTGEFAVVVKVKGALFYIHRSTSIHRWIGCRRVIERRTILYTPQYFHTPVNWLSSWNRNLFFQKNRFDLAKKGKTLNIYTYIHANQRRHTQA